MQGTAWAALLLTGAATVAVTARNGAEPNQPSLASRETSDLRQTSQQGPTPFVGVLDEHPAIQYAFRPTRDRVSVLNRSLAQGTMSLAFQERGGYLPAALEALGVAPESQLLVFSKTGIQRDATGPRNPRALFFDDSVVVGYIPGARFLELATHDPEQGVVFYTLDQTATSKPAFARRTGCLSCHVSSSTLEVPGMINRSMFTTADGGVMRGTGLKPVPPASHTVNHRTSLLQRWGGMYVTGNYTTPFYGRTEHMGNVTVSVHPSSGPVTTSNEVFIQWLNSAPETRGYVSPDSDIAALMVFDHQMHAVNLLTRLNWEARVAANDGRVDFANGTLRGLVDELTDYLLFVDEVPPPAKLAPRLGFAERFTAAGKKDRHGRSLRQLDLENRLLRYPCSYMVYTDAFENLPTSAKDAVYQRMWTILSGRDTDPKYSHLSAADRRAIIEILRDTKSDLPRGWRRELVPGS